MLSMAWGDEKNGWGEWEIQAFSYGINKYRNKRHSIENIVSDIVIALHGDKW